MAALDQRDEYAAAWILTLVHPTEGTKIVSTVDLADAADVTTITAFAQGRIRNGGAIAVIEEDPGFAGGVVVPVVSGEIVIENADGYIDAAEEWREVPATLAHYDRTTGTLTAEFSGVVRTFTDNLNVVSITLGSAIDRVLDMMVPTQLVTTAEFPYATDLGAAIPVVYGTEAVVTPPFVRHDATSSAAGTIGAITAGGFDFLVGWGKIITAAYRGPQISQVYGDVDLTRAGLENLTPWESAPGTPMYASASTFTVSGDLRHRYAPGRTLRYRDTAGGSTDQYTHVLSASYAVGTPGTTTVTVADADLDSGLASVYISGDYVCERNRYAIDGRPLVNLRFPYAPSGGLRVVCRDNRGTAGAALSHPIDVIEDILADTDFGASQTVDATTFAAAKTVLTSAGLGSAVQGALADDGQQRRLRDVLADLTWFRGVRLKYDGTKFLAYADDTPASVAATLGMGPGTNNVVKSFGGLTRSSTQSAAKTLTLHYAPAGRASQGLTKFTPRDFYYSITSNTITAVGVTVERHSRWIRSHDIAKRVVGYWAKRLQYEDRASVLTCTQDARTITLGELVAVEVKYTDPEGNARTTLNEDMRVRRIEKRLGDVVLTVRGYDSSIYSYTGSDLTAPSDADPDEQLATAGGGSNLLVNPDWSTRLRRTSAPDASTSDSASIPGWIVQNVGNHIAAGGITITPDGGCIGLHKIAVAVSGSNANLASRVPRLVGLRVLDGSLVGPSVMSSRPHFFSVYADTATGWRMRINWVSQTGALIRTDNPALVRSDERNGLGWYRFYGAVRSPAETAGTPGTSVAYCYPEICFVTAGTYQLDAAQFEAASRSAARPSQWKHYVSGGIDPGLFRAGKHTIMPSASDPSMFEEFSARVSASTSFSGSSSVTLLGDDGNPLIPAGYDCRRVLLYVVSGITFGGGGASYDCGTSIDGKLWGSGLTYVTAGNQSTGADVVAVTPIFFPTATNVIVTPDAGTMSGELKAVAFLSRQTAPNA